MKTSFNDKILFFFGSLMLLASSNSALASPSSSTIFDRQMKAVGVSPVTIPAELDSEQQAQLDIEFEKLESSLKDSAIADYSDEIKTSKAKARTGLPADLNAE